MKGVYNMGKPMDNNDLLYFWKKIRSAPLIHKDGRSLNLAAELIDGASDTTLAITPTVLGGGSSNYPASYGIAWHFSADNSSKYRDFTLWTQANADTPLFIRRYQHLGAPCPSGWKRIWEGSVGSPSIKAIAVGTNTATPSGTQIDFPANRFTSAPYVGIMQYYISASGGVPTYPISILYQQISATMFKAVVPSGQPNCEFFWIAVELWE
jgi:hypothetical protein